MNTTISLHAFKALSVAALTIILFGCEYYEDQSPQFAVDVESFVRVEKPMYFGSFDVEKVNNNTILIKTSVFFCGDIGRPKIISRPREGYFSHTISIASRNSLKFFGGCCECSNDLTLRVMDNFGKGDYIYFVANNETFGHKVLIDFPLR